MEGKIVAILKHFRVTESLADLIDRLLSMDPKKRMKSTEALNHPFFT
jgi:serine/threonine protein kinase